MSTIYSVIVTFLATVTLVIAYSFRKEYLKKHDKYYSENTKVSKVYTVLKIILYCMVLIRWFGILAISLSVLHYIVCCIIEEEEFLITLKDDFKNIKSMFFQFIAILAIAICLLYLIALLSTPFFYKDEHVYKDKSEVIEICSFSFDDNMDSSKDSYLSYDGKSYSYYTKNSNGEYEINSIPQECTFITYINKGDEARIEHKVKEKVKITKSKVFEADDKESIESTLDIYIAFIPEGSLVKNYSTE